MCPARVILARHAESEDNVASTLSAAVPGRDLTDRGRQQAAELAAGLRDEAVSHIYASPLTRARQTAAIVAERTGVSVTVLEDLREFSLGVHEGGERDDVVGSIDEAFLAWLLEGELDRRIDGGESGREVLDRFSAAMADIADAHRGQCVLVVSHGGTLSLGLTAMCANLRPTFVRDHPLLNAARVDVEYDGDGWTAQRWAGLDLRAGIA